MFSISTVASSTRIPTASASPPSVMMLMVSCRKLSTMIDVRIESGIEMAMISVLRQLPRNSRIINAGQAGGDHRFADHAVDGGAHENGLIGQRLDFSSGGSVAATTGSSLRTPVHHRERGGVARFHDREQNAARAVLPHDIGLRREAVANVADVANINRRAVDHFDWEIVEGVDVCRGWNSGQRHIRTGRFWKCRPE